ncbi:PQQ-dependent sugar dehydrogenase [Pseudoalteromonas sp. SSM20]|uniref:PQQ-dependent sugar dehydrogenase n=1 Tax=Pseudoalteromonas sp. SSM20 TaxID=3139394 RepID=UPI003BA923EC
MLKLTKLMQLKKGLCLHTSKDFSCKQWLLYFAVSVFCSNAAANDAALPLERYTTHTLATKLNSPWSMVELPNGTWLITERDGNVVIVNGENQSRVKLDLAGLYVAGQGGLLDVVLAPDFEQSKTVFFTYAQGELKANRLVVATAEFNGTEFSKPQIIYSVATDKGTPQHYAGRALILPDNTLLISSGDGFDYREQAQVVTNQLGKILRINLDGTIPNDNPFISHADAKAHAVFTLGHRNPQGLVYDYDAKRIVSHEHGPAGGDELNFLSKGENYGWPVITFGKDYSQARISPFTEYKGMNQPSVNWTPSIAPSGMAYYGTRHTQFASLQKQVLITTLVDRKLYAVNIANNRFEQTAVFPEISGRLRDVFISNAGNIAVLTDGKDAKLHLITAQ